MPGRALLKRNLCSCVFEEKNLIRKTVTQRKQGPESVKIHKVKKNIKNNIQNQLLILTEMKSNKIVKTLILRPFQLQQK